MSRSGAPDASSQITGGQSSKPSMVLIFSITVSGILANVLIAAPLPDIVRYFEVPETNAGLVVSAATFPGIFVAPLIGLMADRIGRRQVLAPCLVIFGISGLAAAAATSFTMLLVWRLVQGIGSAGLVNLAVVTIADNWEGQERTRRIGWNAAVLTVSIAVLPLVGGILGQIGGWRLSFVPYGLALVTAGFVWLRVPDSVAPSGATLREQLAQVSVVIRNKAVWGSISWGFMLFVLIFGLYLTVLPIMLEDQFDLSAGVRGVVLAAPALGSTVAALLLARMRTRFGTRRVMLAASVLFIVGFMTIGLTMSLVVLVGGAVVYGLGEGTTVPTVQDTVAAHSPDVSRGAVMALWVAAARVGQTIGPIIFGFSLDHVAASTSFLIGAAVATFMFVSLLLVGRQPGSGRPERGPDSVPPVAAG